MAHIVPFLYLLMSQFWSFQNRKDGGRAPMALPIDVASLSYNIRIELNVQVSLFDHLNVLRAASSRLQIGFFLPYLYLLRYL